MKKNKFLALLIVLTLSFSVVIYGTDALQQIEAYLASDIQFLVDGESWSPKEIDGSKLIPILYKGRTYVPVRSLLEDKGVTVGFDENTRTVLLDYSTLKRIDKSSPYLVNTIVGGGGGAGKATFKEFTITKNPSYVGGELKLTQEFSFELAEDAVISVAGRTLDGKLEDIAKSGEKYALDQLNLTIDEETGLVKAASINEMSSSDDSALKASIEIEISGPPFRIKITIRF